MVNVKKKRKEMSIKDKLNKVNIMLEKQELLINELIKIKHEMIKEIKTKEGKCYDIPERDTSTYIDKTE